MGGGGGCDEYEGKCQGPGEVGAVFPAVDQSTASPTSVVMMMMMMNYFYYHHY